MRKGTHPRTALGQTAAQMIRRYYLHDVARDSAALTYYLLFAIFPLLIFVSTLLGILELDVDSIVTGLRQIVPGDVAEVVRSYLEYVSGNASRQLMWFSLVFSIWFPMRATGCLLHSLRKAFGKGQPKNILLDQLKIFLFAIWLMVSIGLTLLMITVGRRALYFVSGIITVPDGFINLWSKLRFVAVALLMFVLVTVLYMLALGRRCPLRKVVLIKILWVLGMASSIFWRDPRSAKGSPPVKTKSQRGVISSMVWMLRRMASRLKPEQSAYSFLLMQKGQ